MKRWMKWAAVAAVGLVCVPVMGLSILPPKAVAKPAVAAVKVSTAGHATAVKKTASVAKPVSKTVAKSVSPRPASVRLGKNEVKAMGKTAKANVKTPAHTNLKVSGKGQPSTLSHATHAAPKTTAKSKPVVMTKTPIKPTTLHSEPGKLPAPKSTLSKALARTHTTMN